MAISRVSSASAQATTITIPSHQAGDLIVVATARNNDAAVTAPTGWVRLSSAGGSGISYSIGYKFAQSNSETSGVWTNASILHCSVYRGSVGVVVPGTATINIANVSATIAYAALSQNRIGFSDVWYLGFITQLNSTQAIETAPTGMQNINFQSISGVVKSAIHDTNSTNLNWPLTNVILAGSVNHRGAVIQLFEVAYPALGGGGSYSPIDNLLIG
jgi:hypothetical protein